MQQYWEGADRQGVLGNAKMTNTCGYINVTFLHVAEPHTFIYKYGNLGNLALWI